MQPIRYIDDFDPATYNLLKGVRERDIDNLRSYIDSKCIPTPHLMMTDEQLQGSISFIKLRDPLLALLCHLSYKYTLNPYQQLVVLKRKALKGFMLQLFPESSTVFKRAHRMMDVEDMIHLAPYLAMAKDDDYLFTTSPAENIWDNLDYRWEGMKKLMIETNIISESNSLFSYYTASLDGWKDKNYHEISEGLSIKIYSVVESTYLSYGRIPPMSLIGFPDVPDPYPGELKNRIRF